MRLQTKLTALFFLLVVVLVGIFVLMAIRVYESEEKTAIELRAVSLISILAESITKSYYDPGRFDQMRSYLSNVRSQPQVEYAYVFDVEGRILADGTKENQYFNTILNDPFHQRAIRAEKPLLQYRDGRFRAPGNVLDIAQAFLQPTGEKLGGVRIGFSLSPIQEKIARVWRYTLALGGLFVLIGGILSAWMSRRLVHPIEDLVRGTHLVASGNLDITIPVASRDELGTLAESFNQMAARLKENQADLERKVVETSTLYEIGQEITTQIALAPTLQLIVNRARTLLQADLCLVALQQIESGDFAIRAYSGIVVKALTTLRFNPGEGLGGRVAASGKPMLVGDYLVEFRDSPFLSIIQEAGLRSQVAVPLKAHNTVIGVLYVGSQTPHQFHDQDLELLNALADQAAIAIENAKLYEDVRRHAEELETKVEARTRELQEANSVLQNQQVQLEGISRNLDQLYRLSTAIQEPLSLKEQLARVLDAARQVVGIERFYIWVLAPEGDRLEALAGAGFSDEETRGFLGATIPLVEAGAMYKAYREGKALLFDQQNPLPPELRLKPPYSELKALRTKNFTVVPMIARGRPVGILAADNKWTGAPIPPQTVNLLQTFASHVAVAVENARLFQELQARNRDLSETLEQQTATSDVLKVISRSKFDLQPVLETLVANATRLCEAEKGFIFRQNGDQYELAVAHNASPEFIEFIERNPIHPGRGTLVGRVALEGKTVHIPDALADPEYTWLESQRRGGFRTMLGVPMLREGTPIGVIAIWRDEVRPFTDKQIKLVTTFADQAVIAIENVRLFQELQARTGELGRSVEELKALGAVSQAVSSTLDLHNVLTTIVAHAVNLSGTNGGVVYEYDENAREFHLRASHRTEGDLIEVLRKGPLHLGEGPVGQAAAVQTPVQIPDILQEQSGVVSKVRSTFERYGYRSLLAVPLLLAHHWQSASDQKIVGGLLVWRQASGRFSPEVVNMLQTFATQSVLAIQNARLFREIEEKGRELELASMHKSQFLANMSHELRTPLNAILGYTELILDNIYGEVPSKIQDVLQRVQHGGRHLLGLINDVLDLSKIEAGQLTLSVNDYSMEQVVQTVVTAVESLAAEKKLTLKVTVPPNLPLGRGDERRITQVLLNLVGNAIKFTEFGEVRVDASVSDGEFVVAVADTGPGISTANQRKIFDEFQQADSSSTRAKGGTGLGLAIAKRIIELHGGHIGVDSSPGEGSTFWFKVPLRVGGRVE
jgi:signal transduction histidine kinase